MPSIMVLDGDNRAALAIVRALGAKGIKVFVGGHSRGSRAFFSKYCAGHFIYPVGNPAQMHAGILQHVKKFKPDVLMPLFDRTFLTVLQYRQDYLDHVRLPPMPSLQVFKQMQDKEQILSLADRCGVTTPRTTCPQGVGELRAMASGLTYPVIIKPRVSLGGYGIKLVSSAVDLIKAYEDMTRSEGGRWWLPEIDVNVARPLVQEYIAGDVLNYYGYFEEGERRAVFTTQTLRSYPLPFGHSIAARAVRNDKIKDLSEMILRPVRWDGVIDIQYVLDPRDKVPKLIDINPRMWSTVELAMISGVDFPELLFRRAMGEEIKGIADSQDGKEFCWVLFDTLFYYLKSSDKRRVWREYTRMHGAYNEILWADPWPHLAHLVRTLLRVHGRG